MNERTFLRRLLVMNQYEILEKMQSGKEYTAVQLMRKISERKNNIYRKLDRLVSYGLLKGWEVNKTTTRGTKLTKVYMKEEEK